MNKFYDKRGERLVCVGERSTQEFWNKIWSTKIYTRTKIKDFLVGPITKKYLPRGAKIIFEGGCGDGRYVYLLTQLGYKAVGIDSAKKTIASIKAQSPNLSVKVGNIVRTGFPKDSFDGYWSLGVIEHFPRGYERIIIEMKRIIRSQGYLFLAFPYMSPLRRMKVRLGLYPVSHADSKFYQYIFDERKVRADFSRHGFSLVTRRPYDGYKGLKEEVRMLLSTWLLIDKISQKYVLGYYIKLLISILVLPLTAHGILLVFKKT